jgi:NDP-sugar pyrophosphorylase family protein
LELWDLEFRNDQMITQAFILGAGLGTRLRPLTDAFPKPLVPLFHKPLAGWALEACEAVGCKRFAINTHHLPEKWEGFGAGRDVTFFHEPALLETGGGLKNIESWLNDESLLIHNGDVFSSMDLKKLVHAHECVQAEAKNAFLWEMTTAWKMFGVRFEVCRVRMFSREFTA